MIVVDREGNIITKGESQNRLLKRLYGTFLGRCALKILVSKWVTNLGGMYMNSRVSCRRIKPFIIENDIDMTEYEERKFVSYNDFFTREIRPGKRPINNNIDAFVAPADAKLSYYKIKRDSYFTIKQQCYQLHDLIEDKTLAKEYEGGDCFIYRLTVDDYHRYSFIDNGKIISSKYIPGVFHTVNPIANDYYPIYARNAREYTVIETENFGQIIQIEVGAMMVGKIVNHSLQNCKKGQEKGRFEFGGSTIIILVKKGFITVDEDIVNNSLNDKETVVKLGMKVGWKNFD